MNQPRSCVLKLALTLGFALGTAGCHSAAITATIHNDTAQPISLIQVDYPSASFGIQTLQPGEDFQYHFTVRGQGPIKLTYIDAAQHDHKATGPGLREGNDGALRILLAQDGVHWEPASFPASR